MYVYENNVHYITFENYETLQNPHSHHGRLNQEIADSDSNCNDINKNKHIKEYKSI